ncbi:zeta toxin family protein [Holosporaceae bacterium 'Namur']|nr:zeta toxin family protein [Holosporaceae bacterium 'Namur']
MKNFDCLSELELFCALSTDVDEIKITTLNYKDLFIKLEEIHEKLFPYTFNFLITDSHQIVDKEKVLSLENLLEKLEKTLSLIPLAALANFYYEFMHLKPFEYGNSIVLRIFIFKLAKFIDMNLDFRVLTDREAKELITNKSLGSITKILEKAANRKYPTKELKIIHPWPKWPEASFKINDKNFLCFEGKYLVAIDGTLFPIKNIKEALGNDDCIDSLKYKKKLFSISAKKVIDGIPIEPSKVPLVSLNHDILTGLSIDKELPILVNAIRKNNISMPELPEKINEIKSKEDNLVTNIAEKASERLVHTLKLIKHIAENAFLSKQPTIEHDLFVTMGGSGSGKGLLNEIALEASDNNLVEASLDKSRYFSFIYKLLIACRHHNDDYKIIAQFAYVLRDTILNYALAEGYNLLFDGSGIPYKGRYDHLVEIFKNSGFRTHILVAETPFYLIHSKNKGIDSYHKIINRFRYSKDHRALPWRIAIQKHAGQPQSQLNAACDKNVKSFLIIDTLPKKEKTYILAFTKDINKDDLTYFLTYKNQPEKLLEYIIQKQLLPNKRINNIMPEMLDFLICTKLSRESYRVLIITNKQRFIESLKKCLLNAESKGKEDIFFNPFPYLIPAIDFEYKY